MIKSDIAPNKKGTASSLDKTTRYCQDNRADLYV